MQTIDDWLLDKLACPRDHGRLTLEGTTLVCQQGHSYPVIEGIPVLLLDDVAVTHPVCCATLENASRPTQAARAQPQDSAIDPYVQEQIAATNGILYVPLIKHLKDYPIPELRLPPGSKKLLLDIGCNWGRWSISAARKDYQVIGIDPNLDAVQAACRVAAQLGLNIRFVVGDARYMPFASACFDYAFSYSVLQHFSKSDANLAIRETGRVLQNDGVAFIQLPNKIGLRVLYNQFRHRNSDDIFRVRYWSLSEIKSTFESSIGATTLSIDGFFGLGIQASDIEILPARYQTVVELSERLRKLSRYVPALDNHWC